MDYEPSGPIDTRPLLALTALAREMREAVPEPTRAQLDAGWTVVSARITAQRARRRAAKRFALAAVVAIIAGVSAPWLARLRSPGGTPPALSYDIEGGDLVDGGYLRESSEDGIKLHFAEGTEFVLMPGTRGRLRSVSSVGARIAIEHGTASFQVTPRRNAHWQVDVGPFLVTVKGTVFTVSWDAVTERFDLRLQHGSVSVAGPLSSGEVLVKAGQRLAVNLPRKETVITEQSAQETWLLPSAGMQGPDTPDALPPTAAPQEMPGRAADMGRRAAEAKATPRRSWTEAVAAGEWNRILDDAARAGIGHVLAQAPSEDLIALADAARYGRRVGLARVALLAERRRFAGSPAARDAAFLLGRLEEASHGETKQAMDWYDSYLSEAPAGAHAAEALGRKMMVAKQLQGASEAAALARDYLRRFPSGPYAGAARALLAH